MNITALSTNTTKHISLVVFFIIKHKSLEEVRHIITLNNTD